MAPRLSVVVPFYNVEPYFEECLASLAAQTLTDLEVIMVDDGSADGSAVIAKTHATRDPRFVLVEQENQGLGLARNTGVRHATGEYLAFADSDDVLPPHAYERMVGCLEETGSDLVTGGVQVLSGTRLTRASFYGDAFHTTRTRTHVSRDRELLHDRTAWNKVFRRSFWDAHGFAFPAGLYEDAPVTLPAHVRAGNVDVLRDTVYHYRKRTGTDRSITQRRTEPGNLEDRVASIRSVSRFLGEHAPALKPHYDLTTLQKDLTLFVDAAEDGDDDYRERLCAIVGSYLREADPALVRRLPSIQRLKYHLVRAGRAADLAEVREYERTGLPVAPVRAAGLLRRRRYAGHPFRDDAERAVPAGIYDCTAELELHAQVDEVAWRDGKLVVTGHAYVPGLDMGMDDRIEVWLQHAKMRRRHRPVVRRVERPDVTAGSDQPAARYDGSGFEVEIDPAALASVPNWRSADWLLHVAVRTGRGRDRLRLTGPVRRCGPAAQWPRFRILPQDVRVQLVQADDQGLAVRFRKAAARVTGHRRDGDVLELTGHVTRPVGPGDVAVLTCRERGTSAEAPVVADGTDGFRVRLPLDLLGDAAVTEHWDVSLRAKGGKKTRLSVAEDFTEAVTEAPNGTGVLLTRTRYGNLTVVAGPPRPLVTGVHWEDDRLLVTGESAGDHPDTLVLHRRRTDVRRTFPITWDGPRFTAVLPLAAVPTLAGELPLASGMWDLRVGDGAALAPTRALLGDLPAPRDLAGFHYRVWPARGGEGLCVGARVARPDDERGPYAQRLLRERDYPAFLRRPVRDLVMFESYFGWQYSCNPKAVYEEFRRRDTGHELVWVMGDQPFRVPDGGRAVARHSREYYELTAAARIVVNNVAQPTSYQARPDQVYVQTWHGTPLKSVGFDMNWSRMERRDQRIRELTDDVSRWDLLISQNPFSSEAMRRAFRYDGEILESGYPRNDAAYGPDAADVRASARARLGIPAHKRAVLYAPTWRDNLQTTREGLVRHHLGLDLDHAAAVLGPDTVLLVRSHHLLNAAVPVGHEGFVVDVTAWPDVTELFLAADMLVTDYSSLMCDFAGLGKPIVLFAPDLEEYDREVRGLTYDLAARPPGPVVATSRELVETLRDLDAAPDELADFAATFCPWDDGGAAARVVDRLLAY